MYKIKYSLLIILICFLIYSPNASAEKIRAFVSDKPWEIGIDIENFKPWDVLQPKTILGGNFTNGMIITIIAEKENPSISIGQAQKKYWIYGQPGDQITEFTNENMIIVSSRDSKPVLRREFNGYVVKDDLSFDIHVSSDLSKTTKEQVLKTIRSFEIRLSSEKEDMEKLIEDLKASEKETAQEQLYLAFIKKHPHNSWAYGLLGESYYRMRQHALAEKSYLRALDNHKTQPIANPLNLWLCYDGLGLIYAMSQRYEPAKLYFMKGYECAKSMASDERLADSAYNLACLHAESGDLPSCLKYMREAVKLNPEKKISAKKDSSFASLRNKSEFDMLISQ